MQPRPQLDGALDGVVGHVELCAEGQLRALLIMRGVRLRAGGIGRQVAERRVRQHGRLVRLGVVVRGQGAMPVNLMSAHAHGWILEPVAEYSALLDGAHGFLDLFRVSGGAVQQQLAVWQPQLHVAGHRLVVQAEIVGDAAEQDVQQLVLAPDQRQLVLVAEDAVPAVRALEGVLHQLMMDMMLVAVRMRFVEQPRLRDEQTVGSAVARQRL